MPTVTRRTATSVDARCDLCPGVMVLWQDRAKHTTHLLPEPAPEPPAPKPTRFWSDASPINAPIPANPRLDPNSASIAALLTSAPPKLSIVAYGTLIYRATADTPRVTVGAVGSGAGLEVTNIGAWGANPFAGLTMPLDPSWVGSPGYPNEAWRDGAAAIIDTNGRVFSLFQLVPAANGKPARITWGGWQWTDGNLITDQPGGNATGAGFSRLAGVVTRAELAAGKIDHALVVASRFVRPGTYRHPAKKTDGKYLVGGTATLTNSVPEGARLQLNPDLDLSHLSAKAQTIGKAAQTHGAYVMDNGGGAPFHIICETPEPSGYVSKGDYAYAITDPTYVAAGITTDAAALAEIPWAGNLRVLNAWDGT